MNSIQRAENLTSRQIQVLYHASCDLDLVETGAKLGVSQNTVKAHRSNIFRVLNVGNITAAVSVGIISGKLDTQIIKDFYRNKS